MALYQKKWWKKVFKEEKTKKVDFPEEIEAITDFLMDLPKDKEELLKLLSELEELDKESRVSNEGLQQINLETQAKLLDKLIERYEFMQNDVDINGLRVKMLAEEFLNRAKKAGLKDLVREKKDSELWKMQW